MIGNQERLPSLSRSLAWLVALVFVACVLSITLRSDEPPESTSLSAVTHKHTNRLAGQTSPYLLQHAHNPVHWYPWGEEAFAKAKAENKPIFLSVGYSTCYWCHVMEVESFEDEEVAEVLNRHFIAIKVDREERPDIDEQYMLVTQMMTGRGGWPNSVWLTPGGKPWMSGTYFPKPRFIDALKELAEVWKTRRPDVDRQADALAEAVARAAGPATAGSTQTTSTDLSTGADVESRELGFSDELPRLTAFDLAKQLDQAHGGFGGAPKFPPHGILRLLSDQYRRTGNPALAKPITETLDAMWRGGFHDHIGGGFHRYSTDEAWLLPHFEKMLYDNAQLIRAYADGYQISQAVRYREAVADIFQWVRREMTSPEKAFYSALDSGEVGKEGEAYVWPQSKLTDTLGQQEAKLFSEVYQFRSEGNFREESSGHLSGTNIPHLKQPIAVIAKQRGETASELESKLAQMRAQLLTERLRWQQPRRDDKILTSWNGLMIGSLAYAGRILEEPAYVAAATDAADFLLNDMIREGQLYRSSRGGSVSQLAYLDDYAFLLEALLELDLATKDARWVEAAERLGKVMIDQFEDSSEGGFFFSSADHEALLVRSKYLSGGGNLPSPNGVAAHALLRLAERTGNSRFQKSGRRVLESLSTLIKSQPSTCEELLCAAALLSDPSPFSPQRAGPVQIQVTLSSESLLVGETSTVRVSVQIDSGWHLYGKNADAKFVQPSQVIVADAPSLTIGEITEPTPQTKFDSVLKQTLQLYVGTVEYEFPVSAKPNCAPGEYHIEVQVVTQACDDQRCLPTRNTWFRIPLQVRQADQGDDS